MTEKTTIKPWGLSRMSEFDDTSHQKLGSNTATHPSPVAGRAGNGDPDSDNGYDGDRD